MTAQSKHLQDGVKAEKIAAEYLQKQGLRLVEKNFHSPYGEIDLIMQDGKALVFVEVRMRQSMQFGGAGMSITSAKQLKLNRTAEYYLQTHGQVACRFDAVLMHATDINAVEWIKNAF